jgi:hypothetical protein
MSSRPIPIVAAIDQIATLPADQRQLLYAALEEMGLGPKRDKEYLKSVAVLSTHVAMITQRKFDKQRRDRQSDPATIEQDAEIHRLRTENKKRWGWKSLGRKFDMTEGGARAAYKRHQQRLDENRSN